MVVKYSKCGMNCGGCPWGIYAREGMTPKQIEDFRNQAKKILGYTPFEQPCMGCQVPDAEQPKGAKLPPKKCLIRQCVDQSGFENCAYCRQFPCEHEEQTGTLWIREKFEQKLGHGISDAEYLQFVEPYDAITHLQAIREKLPSQDFKEPIKFPALAATLIPFPKDIDLPKKQQTALKQIHQILRSIKESSLGLSQIELFPQRERLKKRTLHFFRCLWILSRFGNYQSSSKQLSVDAKTFYENRGKQRGLGDYAFIKDVVIPNFEPLGIHVQHIPLNEGFKTPTGALRPKNWELTLSLPAERNPLSILKALQAYTLKLDETKGSKAFTQFTKADMTIYVP